MRFLFLFTSAICLIGCETSAPKPAAPKAGDRGTYTRTLDNGTPVTVVIRADGSLLRTVGDEVGGGTTRVEDNQLCFTFDDDQDKEYCWENGPIRADGSFESTGPDGTVLEISYSPIVE